MAKGGAGATHAHTARKASTPRIMNEQQVELMKQILLKRHHEWKRPRHHNYPYYAAILLLLFGDFYAITNESIKANPLAFYTAFAITFLLAGVFIMLVHHHININSPQRLEEVIEDEINRFRFERIARR